MMVIVDCDNHDGHYDRSDVDYGNSSWYDNEGWWYIDSCVMVIVASRLSYSLIDAYISGGLAVSATFLINVLLFVIFFGQVDRIIMMSMSMNDNNEYEW